MTQAHYRIVPHDGGWAYVLAGSFSEPFGSREQAVQAARQAAEEQGVAGDTLVIEYQDEAGVWHNELSQGTDRPDADVIEEQG